jgi:hypothetical protein
LDSYGKRKPIELSWNYLYKAVGGKIMNISKRIISLFILFLISIITVSAQDIEKLQTNLDGILWYKLSGHSLSLRYFFPDGTFCYNSYFLERGRNTAIKPLANTAPIPYAIKDFGIIEIRKTRYQFRVGNQSLVLFLDSNSDFPDVYTLVAAPITQDALYGNWKITGEQVDTNMTINEKSIVVIEGKKEETYNYTFVGYPVLKFEDHKTTHPYFLLDKDILILSLPEKTARIFQRQN